MTLGKTSIHLFICDSKACIINICWKQRMCYFGNKCIEIRYFQLCVGKNLSQTGAKTGSDYSASLHLSCLLTCHYRMGSMCQRIKVGRGTLNKEDQESKNTVLQMEWVSSYPYIFGVSFDNAIII